jgi:hypothetical protein
MPAPTKAQAELFQARFFIRYARRLARFPARNSATIKLPRCTTEGVPLDEQTYHGMFCFRTAYTPSDRQLRERGDIPTDEPGRVGPVYFHVEGDDGIEPPTSKRNATQAE